MGHPIATFPGGLENTSNSGKTSPAAARSGMGALIGVAITLLVALVLMGVSVTGMSAMNVKRSVANQQSLQTYYVAQAGIQEGLATRMVPRSNYLDFDATSGIPAYFPTSGRVYLHPDTRTELLGLYRYIIVGGDPARNPNTGNYDNSLLLSTSPSQPFYVISKGSICKHRTTGEVGVDMISPNSGNPTCKSSSYQIDEMTLVSKVDMSRQDASAPDMDLVKDFKIYKNSSSITLDTPVFVPSYATPTKSFNFETAWSGSGGEVTPTKVVFYNLSDTSVSANKVWDITSKSMTVTTPISAKSVIRLYFQGGIDHRTMFADPKKYSIADCQADANKCNIRLRNLNTNQVFGGATLIPVLPSGTQLIFYPPLQSSKAMSGGTNYRLEIDSAVSDYKGKSVGSPMYSIQFKTS